MTNIDFTDKLINGQLGTVIHCKSRNSQVDIIYINFNDNNAGLKAQRRDQYPINLNQYL